MLSSEPKSLLAAKVLFKIIRQADRNAMPVQNNGRSAGKEVGDGAIAETIGLIPHHRTDPASYFLWTILSI
jgi:hypothetical protein